MAKKMPFEQSKQDKEFKRFGKEGSKREEMFDRKQQKKGRK